jgi:tetratricopeptide (TPR) repeat protein
MRRMMQRAALMAAALLVTAGLGFAQMGTFMGKVTGPDGKPLRDAVIKIERKDIRGSWQTKSNRRGEYIYSGMQVGGTYRIECHVNNQMMDAADNVRATMGEPVEVNFDLKKIADQRAAQRQAMESGQMTEEMKRDMTPEQRAAMEKQMKQQQQQLAKNKALNDAFNEAMSALQAKDFAASSAAFEKAAELDPKQHAVWANMASAYEGLAASDPSAYDKAANAYTKALEIKPDDAGLYNNFALMRVRQGNIEEAAAMLDKAAALDPENAGRYFFNLGAVMVNNRQDDGALAAFDKCISAAPKYANCYYFKANVLSGRMTMDGDRAVAPEGMVPALEKYLELEPNGPHAEAAQGLLSVFSSAIETTYTNPDAKKGKATKKKK